MSDLKTILLAEAGAAVAKDFDESQHPRDDHGRFAESGGGDKLGTVVHVSQGKGFAEQHFAAVKTSEGWNRIDGYRPVKDQPHGTLGAPLDVSNMQRHEVLHPGIGDDGKITHMFQVAALPDGAKIRDGVTGITYEKKGGHWIGSEGQPLEYYHFDPERKFQVTKADFDESKHPRDEHGRWASDGGGGTATANGHVHPAFQFYSPNEAENLDFEQAYKNLDTEDQKRFVQISRDIDQHVGLDARPLNAIGDWADGAENSVFNVIRNAPSFQAVEYSAALKGDIANQKAVIPFMVGDGNDSVYQFHLDQGVREVRKTLDDAGIQYRTLIPTAKGVDVAIYDPGSELGDKIGALAEKYDTDVERQRGRGEFLGGETRDEGHQAYAHVIQAWEGTHPRYNRPEPGQRLSVSRSQKALKVDSNGIYGTHGHEIFDAVLKASLESGSNQIRAHLEAFKALRAAGFVHADGVWVAKDFDESKHPRVPAGSTGGGQFTSGGGAFSTAESASDYRETDRARFETLKDKLAQTNNALLPYLGRPDAPEVQAKMDEMKGIVKEIHTLHADPGGTEGIGLPGGPRDIVVVGAGPGGMASSIMGAADGLDTLLVEANAVPGGQSKYSSRIENFPGFPMGVTGSQLAQTSFEQATRLGAEAKLGVRVTGLTYDPATELKTLTLSDGEKVQSRAVVIAGGVEFRKLDFPGSDSPSVIYADGKTLATVGKDAPVVVMGGSNAAAQAALGASRTASKVYILSRSPIEKGMSEYQVRAVRNDPKIQIIENDQIAKLTSDPSSALETMTTAGGKQIPVKAVGVFAGSAPKTDWLPSEIERSKDGKLVVNRDFETAIPGVFAVGDIREGSIGRVGAAVGEGQMAERNIFQYFDRVKQRQAAVAKRGTMTDAEFNKLIDQFFALDKENPYIGQFYEPPDVPVVQKVDANGIQGRAGQAVFARVLKRELALGASNTSAHITAFKALRAAGYVHADGVWKAEPAVGDVHINRPMGAVKYTGDDKPKPDDEDEEEDKKKRGKTKDDPGTVDVDPYHGVTPAPPKTAKRKEKDDPGTSDVAPESGDTLALPLPSYQHNQFNNEHKIAKRISGSSDISLSRQGVRLMTRLGKRIHERGGLDTLGSSTLKRGVQSAELIAKENPATELEEPTRALVPWRLGQYEGRMPGDVKDFITAFIEHPDERPPGRGADGSKAETFNEATRRQLKYLRKKHDEWEADPTMKMGDVMHSRGLELLQAYVDAGCPTAEDFVKNLDTKYLVHPDDPEHNAFLVWKKHKIKELDPEDDDPLEGGHYLILHGLTNDDTDAGNAEELRKYHPPLVVLHAASAACEQGLAIEGITQALADDTGIGEGEIRKVADFFSQSEGKALDPLVVNAWGGPHARKWVEKCLRKIAKPIPEAAAFEIEGEVVKADEDQQLVFGWASIVTIDGKPITDTQGDIITAKTLEAAGYDYVLESRKGGEMHKLLKDEVKQVAKLVESCVLTKDKQAAMQNSLRKQDISATVDIDAVGWWIGFHIEDPDVWGDVKSGKLRAFSIGGKGKRLKIAD